MLHPPPIPVAAEDLLRHRAWVRSLARTLVRDEAAVDDLEQETWLAAVERPPAHGEAATTWLGRVVRSRAIDLFRRRARRAAREAVAARKEAVPSAEETVARADAHRRVVDAVMALDEPFRSAVLLRFFEDLPPREIARRTGVPVETARTRVRRGVERLRERLAPEGRRGDDGRAALLLLLASSGGIAGRSPSAGTGAGLGAGGALALAVGSKAGVTAAVVVLVASWLVMGRNASEDETGAVGDTSHDAPSVGTASPRATARAARLAGDAPVAESGDSAATPEATPPATTRLHIRREDGTSLDGATALLHDAARILRTERLGPECVFDAGPPAPGRVIVVVQDGHVPQTVAVPETAGESAVVLPSGAAISGRVLLRGEAPGEPVEVSLWLARPVVPPALLREPAEGEASFPNLQGATLRTSPDGSFRFDGLVAGVAGSVGPQWGWTPKDRDAGDFTAPRTGIVLDCTRHPRVTGRLVRRGTRKPVAGASVVLSHRDATSSSTSRVTADPDGRFAVYISHVTPPEEFGVEVFEADGVASHRSSVRGPFDRDRDAGTIEVADPWEVTRKLRVVDETGRPIAGAFAAADDESGWASAGSGADGIVALPGTGTAPRVVVAAPGFGHATAVVPSGPEAVDVVLRRAATLRVRVGDGMPPGAVVVVAGPHPAFDEPMSAAAAIVLRRLTSDSPVARLRDAGGRDVSWFSADGPVTLPCVRPGVTLRVEAFDVAGDPFDGCDVTLAPGDDRVVELKAVPTRALRGRVLGAEGRPVRGASVLVRSPRANDDLAWSGGWRAWADCDDDGRFVMDGLCGGGVSVVATAPGHVAWSKRDVTPGGVALDVRLALALRLRVRTVTADGSPVPAGMVRARATDPGPWDGLVEGFDTAEQADGTWIVDGLPPGEVELVVGPEESPVTKRVRTDSGTVDVVLDVVLPAAPKEE